MRDLVVMGLTGLLCLLSPFQPRLGLYGYYWFALMRPDILSWSGPNRYSLFIALSALFSNSGRVLAGLPILFRNPLCRTLLLLFGVYTLSVPLAVRPELCYEPYSLFLRMIVMALLIPLAVVEEKELGMLVVIMAASIGLLAGKFGLSGILSGGARFGQGYGGMLSDNNTMALAFVMAVPLCWFSRLLVKPPWARIGLQALALLSVAGTVFTHSRGGVLAVGVTLLWIAWRSKHKLLVGLMVIGVGGASVYVVRDTLVSRLETIAAPTEEASAKSRIILAQSAVKLWLDHPLFGVGFTENNERELISKYVPPAYREEYAGKVIHNTYLQVLVDSGIFALLLYCLLLFGSIWRLEKTIRRLKVVGTLEDAAIPLGLQTALISYAVGSTFLSRTSFDFFYILAMTSAAWLEISRAKDDSISIEGAAIATPANGPIVDESAPPASVALEDRPWLTQPQGRSRLRMGRERRERP